MVYPKNGSGSAIICILGPCVCLQLIVSGDPPERQNNSSEGDRTKLIILYKCTTDGSKLEGLS